MQYQHSFIENDYFFLNLIIHSLPMKIKRKMAAVETLSNNAAKNNGAHFVILLRSSVTEIT